MLEWKVLGKKTLPVGIQDTWESQLEALAKKREDSAKFLKMMGKADIAYKFDTIRELHIFQVTLPSKTSMADLEYFRDYIQTLRKSARAVMVSLEGKEQKSTVVISADEDVNEYQVRRETHEVHPMDRSHSH
ncbi:MAG: hypothetical protein A4E32_01701 [Methanomassiliicoccales archaeon PtaU1.Bin124]|nr:MAG: hypothetical protein A4E32_01701 [Methanomassiliicoccales archaeon PtaU1.Bin124]